MDGSVVVHSLLAATVVATVAAVWAFWRLSRREGRRALPAVLTVTVGLCVWYVAVFLLLLCFADNDISRRQLLVRSFFWGRRQFDSEAWKASYPIDTSLTIQEAIEEEDRRGEMLFSLLRTHELIGMERGEAVQLLGEPDWTGKQEGYMIGVHTGIDPDVFHVSYRDGRVADYRVKQY